MSHQAHAIKNLQVNNKLAFSRRPLSKVASLSLRSQIIPIPPARFAWRIEGFVRTERLSSQQKSVIIVMETILRALG